jgi:hypothetical protein
VWKYDIVTAYRTANIILKVKILWKESLENIVKVTEHDKNVLRNPSYLEERLNRAIFVLELLPRRPN